MEFENPTAADADPATPPALQWVVFACSGRRLAVALDRVREIVTPRPFTRLPGSGREVAGLVGVRSRVVTAYDLGSVLAERPAREYPDHRVLLVDHDGRVLGLVVDEVLAVAALELVAAQPNGAMVLGEADWEGSPAQVLDMDRLLERVLHPTDS